MTSSPITRIRKAWVEALEGPQGEAEGVASIDPQDTRKRKPEMYKYEAQRRLS